MNNLRGSFYSILVRLKGASFTGASNPARCCFYSILVRLKVAKPDNQHVLTQELFLFHTGSIKSPVPDRGNDIDLICFYSILVRLKVDSHGLPVDVAKFLFHTGSIKRYPFSVLPLATSTFLFHTGSIKSAQLMQFRPPQECFYSILVRLKERSELNCYLHILSCFYSILVRLKACQAVP